MDMYKKDMYKKDKDRKDEDKDKDEDEDEETTAFTEMWEVGLMLIYLGYRLTV